ncbi:MAG: phosphate acyltransferase PlsX [Candidatus Omnitrophica bacterium]|nr:phosphate acyltransferase PlsX [Candidatus Omnitrophota bacterium]
MSYRIGLDISGGDFAPFEPLKGAELARKEFGAAVVLIGLKEDLEKAAKKENIDLRNFTFIEAKEKIGMAEPPAYSVRRKKESSIVIGRNLLKEREIDAFVSCGNTGAVVCAATLGIGLIEGVERPGIGVLLPTLKGICLLIDVGANIDPKPLHLFQYGIMASEYYSLVLNKSNPAVGLLNIGEESSKGPDFVKDTYQLFSNSSLNFTGNSEAKDIFLGKCDCIICDGYVGNVALKVSEGLSEAMGKFLLENVKGDFLGSLGLFFLKKALKRIRKITDYAEYGGAPLLGVDGVIIIGHGRSKSYAIKNAIKVAIQELSRDLNIKIKRRINEICQDSRIREILAP